MIKKIATGLATASLFLGATIPVFADTTVSINGNGHRSNNAALVSNKCTQKVYQSNQTNVGVNLTLVGNSGDNNVGGTTGGNVNITTGDVTNTVTVNVTGGNNSADVPNCCCNDDGGAQVTIEDNGSHSNNLARVRNWRLQKIKQRTSTNVWVNIDLLGNSGKNDVWGTTNGDVEVDTGEVENTAEVIVEGGSNEVNP